MPVDEEAVTDVVATVVDVVVPTVVLFDDEVEEVVPPTPVPLVVPLSPQPANAKMVAGTANTACFENDLFVRIRPSVELSNQARRNVAPGLLGF